MKNKIYDGGVTTQNLNDFQEEYDNLAFATWQTYLDFPVLLSPNTVAGVPQKTLGPHPTYAGNSAPISSIFKCFPIVQADVVPATDTYPDRVPQMKVVCETWASKPAGQETALKDMWLASYDHTQTYPVYNEVYGAGAEVYGSRFSFPRLEVRLGDQLRRFGSEPFPFPASGMYTVVYDWNLVAATSVTIARIRLLWRMY